MDKRKWLGPWNIGGGFAMSVWKTTKEGFHLRIFKNGSTLKTIKWYKIKRVGSIGIKSLLLGLGVPPVSADDAVSILTEII